jgi:hypothetical protein
MPGYPLPMMYQYVPPEPPPLPLAGMLAWYDPSDLTTLFQNTDFTNPVTADGQNIRSMLDKSGNNNHWVYSAGSTLTYETDGTLHWMAFTNTYGEVASFVGATNIPQFSMYGGWVVNTGTNIIPFIMGNSGFTQRVLEIQNQSGNSVYVNPTVQCGFTGGSIVGSKRFLGAGFDGPSGNPGKVLLSVNGTPLTQTTGSPTSTATPNTPIILRFPSFTTMAAGGAVGELYGMVLYSLIQSGVNLTQIQEYYDAKMGI